jgi:MFS family permease
MNFVLLTRLFEITGSTLSTSFLWMAYALPAVILGPFAGAFVDARDRRELLAIANIIRAIAALCLALSGQVTTVFIYGVVVLYSSLNQFYVPAEIASLPSLLPPECYPRATGLFILTQQAAVIAGFSIAGGFIKFLGVPWTLGLCAAMLSAAFVCVLFLPPLKTVGAAPLWVCEWDILWRAVIQGFKFLKSQRDVSGPFLLLLSAQGGLSMLLVNVPAAGVELLHITVRSSGFAIVSPFAVGAFLGVIVVTRLLDIGWRKKRLVNAGFLAMGVFLALLIAFAPEIKGWPRAALGAAACLGLGLGFAAIVIPSQTMIQERTPEGLRGRVFSSLSVLGNVTAIIPVMFSGTVAHLIGVRFSLGLVGLLCLVGLVFSRRGGGPTSSRYSRQMTVTGPPHGVGSLTQPGGADEKRGVLCR